MIENYERRGEFGYLDDSPGETDSGGIKDLYAEGRNFIEEGGDTPENGMETDCTEEDCEEPQAY